MADFYMLILCLVNLRNLLHGILYMQSCCLGTEIDRPRKQLSPPFRGCAWRTHHPWHGQWENLRVFPWHLGTRAGLTVPTFTASAGYWLFYPKWLGRKKENVLQSVEEIHLDLCSSSCWLCLIPLLRSVLQLTLYVELITFLMFYATH